jgi:hypothetical protein
MKAYTVKLQGTTPMLFGRQYVLPKLQKESSAEYEERTWRERMHTNDRGEVVLNPLSLKNCLRDAAKYLGESIPGKGKSTYTKHFKSGVMVFNAIEVKDTQGNSIRQADVQPLLLNVPSDGMTGGTKRVPKFFPQVKEGWQGAVEISVLDETITLDVLKRHLTEAGNFIGLGAMRVANGGISGRFKVVSITENK